MRLKEFISKVPTDRWFMRPSGSIRRGDPHRKSNSECECPISSLSGCPSMAFRMVARIHGIDDVLAERIAEAADNECQTPTVNRIRRALLAHCGLSETPRTEPASV